MDAIDFRRELHRHPELSFEEHNTAAFIESELSKLGLQPQRIARTGVVVKIEGRHAEASRRAVVLRAEIDALPIVEQAQVEWQSLNRGVMHGCGHDLHAAILYGVAHEIVTSAYRPEQTLFLLFQPGEESNPGGAQEVLAENPFSGYEVTAVLSQHVEPTLEVGELGFCAGEYMASNDELRFTVRGVGGHAAIRSRIHDAVWASSRFVDSLLSLNTPQRVVSIGRVEALGATNVIPQSVTMEGTMRTFSEVDRAQVKDCIAKISKQIEDTYKVTIDLDIRAGYPCVDNDARLTAVAMATADELYSARNIPRRFTSDDFGFFSLRYPALHYRLGVGAASGALHTAAFCPDERAINIGIGFMFELMKRIQ